MIFVRYTMFKYIKVLIPAIGDTFELEVIV